MGEWRIDWQARQPWCSSTRLRPLTQIRSLQLLRKPSSAIRLRTSPTGWLISHTIPYNENTTDRIKITTHLQQRPQRKHLSHDCDALGNRSQRGVCKQAPGRGRAICQLTVTRFMFFKIKAHMEDALQGLFWSRPKSGHSSIREEGGL